MRGSRGIWVGLVGLVGVVALLAMGRWIGPLVTLLSDPLALRAEVEALGAWGPLALLVAQVLQILITPIPGYPVVVASGILLGGFVGGVVSIVGMIIGATLTAGLTRRFGRPLMHRFFTKADIARWEHLILNDSPWFWFLVLLFPSGEISYFLAGLSKVPLPLFLVALLAARGPAMFVITSFAARAVEVPPQTLIWASIPILVGAGLLFWQRRALRGWFEAQRVLPVSQSESG